MIPNPVTEYNEVPVEECPPSILEVRLLRKELYLLRAEVGVIQNYLKSLEIKSSGRLSVVDWHKQVTEEML